MDGILVAVLIMIVVLAVLALTLNKYAEFWFKVLVTNPFDVINTVMTTSEVPPGWRIRFIEALVKKNPASAFWRAMGRLLVNWYLYRLDRLVHTIKISSKIRSADKADYYEAFKEIRSDWRSAGTDLF
jgi:hypothetical protein